MGPWNHGGGQNASPFQTAESQRVMQAYEWLRFFDHYLKGAAAPTWLTDGITYLDKDKPGDRK